MWRMTRNRDSVRVEIEPRVRFLVMADFVLRPDSDGLQSLRWYKEGRLDLIEEYCRRDVEVTRGLYDFGRKHGHLVYADRQKRPVRVNVSW